jgi:hypothetical protein
MLLRSGHHAEFDIFIPSLYIAFEYQGEQHYKTISVYGNHQVNTNNKYLYTNCVGADAKRFGKENALSKRRNNAD